MRVLIRINNDDGLILSPAAYLLHIVDMKALGPVIAGSRKTAGQTPREIGGDRALSQLLNKPKYSRRR